MGRKICRNTYFFATWLILSVAAPFSLAENVTRDELTSAIQSQMMRVQEFQFLRSEAERLGVRIWLFGGTAAGFGHYVKWDLQRKKGDTRFQPERFDYDYSNIYRSTQDLDIVIDGPEEKAAALETALKKAFPHLQGSKSAWEVRLLREKRDNKEAILKNPDFLNQHTDSNSTGLIEVSVPVAGESVVRDVRGWNAGSSGSTDRNFFLEDLTEGHLHYYFSQSHSNTSRARAGLNPPIFSVIRFLTKAFQYELKIRPDEIETIKKIVNDFNQQTDIANDYTKMWIEKNGKKLIQHAVNIEYACKVLDDLGLRQTLLKIRNNPKVNDSLAW